MHRPLLLLCLTFLELIPAQAQLSSQDVVPLPWNGWHFHSGNDPRCASPDGAGCAVVPGYDPAFEENPASAEEWQRIVVTLPERLRSPQELGLLLENENQPYEVFVNGTLVGHLGDVASHSGPFNSRAVIPFSSNLASNGRVAIAIHAFTQSGLDDHHLAPALGTLASMRSQKDENTLRYLHANWQYFLCFFVVFFVGILFLLLFGLDHTLTEYLWLGIVLSGIGLLRFFELVGVVDVGISLAAANCPYYFLEFLISIATIEFSFALVRKPVWRTFRLLQLASIAMLWSELPFLPVSLATLNHLSRATGVFNDLFLILLALNSLVLLLPVPLCFRSPLREMHWIGGAILFLFFEDLNRWLSKTASFLLPRVPSLPQQVVFGDFVLDLRALAYIVLAIVMLVAMTVRFRRMQSRNRQIESDLEAARTVQRLLIPPSAPETPGFLIESVYLPAQEVGGDFFHIQPASDGSVLIVVGDVSGKGLSAAMTVSTIIGALRAEPAREPAQVLSHLNRTLHGFISGFATCCAALLTREGQFTLASAGHLSPYRNGTELTVPGELPLGLTDDAKYTSAHFPLQRGDRVTFVSDGVVETASGDGELFGFARTATVSTQSARSIAEAAQNFSKGTAPADDITVLTLDCTA